jgi:hypothetical protein
MGLTIQGNDISVYKACIKDAKSLNNLTLPFLFSNTNKLNLGLIFDNMPILTRVEEIIIIYMYIHLQVVYVYGQQY